MKTILKAHNISKTFKRGDINLDILKNIDLSNNDGIVEFDNIIISDVFKTVE